MVINMYVIMNTSITTVDDETYTSSLHESACLTWHKMKMHGRNGRVGRCDNGVGSP
jgi:hypothetical protein